MQKDRGTHNEHLAEAIRDGTRSEEVREANGPSSATGANRSFRSRFEADYCWSNNNDRDAVRACVRAFVRTRDTCVCAETMTACDDF